MVLTKSELIDRAKLDYRPTPKQRSTLKLLKYMTIMGPELVKAAKTGTFDPAIWTGAEKAGGRDELNTMNLWAGVDAPSPV